jgi:hypothetical protein
MPPPPPPPLLSPLSLSLAATATATATCLVLLLPVSCYLCRILPGVNVPAALSCFLIRLIKNKHANANHTPLLILMPRPLLIHDHCSYTATVHTRPLLIHRVPDTKDWNFNRGWIWGCWGKPEVDKLKKKIVLCSGTTIATHKVGG